jgi:hypothetical protein
MRATEGEWVAEMHDDVVTDAGRRILHAIVGHKFPGYFTNAVSSVLLMAAGDDILVVDNASNLPALTEKLRSVAKQEPRVRLLLRDTNDLSRNGKVGGLYDAYNEVVSHALREGYDYLHIMQHDMQLLWWDESVVQCAQEIYAGHPECVNISMFAQPHYSSLGGNLEYVKPKIARLRDYGLTDTGLYHLERWRRHDMRFLGSETAHAKKYLDQGLEVFLHPTPAVGLIPWPAVVRGGRVVGREVERRQQFLLRPLTPSQISHVKEAAEPAELESIGIPWGWTCLTPYWATDLRKIDYWVYAYRDIRRRGPLAARPRWERRGLAAGTSLRGAQRRPRLGLWPALVQPAWYTVRRRADRVLREVRFWLPGRCRVSPAPGDAPRSAPNE